MSTQARAHRRLYRLAAPSTGPLRHARQAPAQSVRCRYANVLPVMPPGLHGYRAADTSVGPRFAKTAPDTASSTRRRRTSISPESP